MAAPKGCLSFSIPSRMGIVAAGRLLSDGGESEKYTTFPGLLLVRK